MTRVLVVEDDRDIAELLDFNLKNEKFSVTCCYNGKTGLEQAQKIHPDLIILDLMLPDMGGLDVCRQLKGDESTSHIPILMLTAKSEEIDRVVGFEMGADDYVTKPFSTRELLLRVRAILRRGHKESSAAIQFGELMIDVEKFRVTVAGEEVKLTALEFKLVQYLLSVRGRVATRDMLLDRVWGYDAALTTRTVDTHIKRLREKLGVAGDYIETVRGVGYRFVETCEST